MAKICSLLNCASPKSVLYLFDSLQINSSRVVGCKRQILPQRTLKKLDTVAQKRGNPGHASKILRRLSYSTSNQRVYLSG